MRSNKSIERLVKGALLISVGIGASAAMAAQPGYYAGVQGGVNDIDDWSARVSLGAGVGLNGVVGSDKGKHWGVVGGRQTENARFELEYQWGNFDITRIQLGALSQAVSADGDYQALTVNAYRTHDFNNKWTGYVGLGIGWGKVTLPQMGFAGGCNCFPASSKSGFVYQGRVGMEYHFDPKHNAFLQYTMLRLPRPAGGTAPSVEYSRKSVGAIGVGYRYNF